MMRITVNMTGERDNPTGRSLYLARPIHVDTTCLECHSTPLRRSCRVGLPVTVVTTGLGGSHMKSWARVSSQQYDEC